MLFTLYNLGDLAIVVRTNKIANLNQSNVDFFVERVAKNESRNNGNYQEIHKIFMINRFVLIIILV